MHIWIYDISSLICLIYQWYYENKQVVLFYINRNKNKTKSSTLDGCDVSLEVKELIHEEIGKKNPKIKRM